MPSTSAPPLKALQQIRHQQPAADLISIPETARRIGLHADTLYRLCRTGQFSPAIHIGGRWTLGDTIRTASPRSPAHRSA